MSDDGKNGLRVAVLGALADTISQEGIRIRDEGAGTWRGLKEQGFPHQKITLPDGGPPVGMLLFNGGTEHVDVDPAALLAYVKANEHPRCLEEVVDRSALTDPEVIALLKEHKPGLVTQRVRPGTADRLIKEAKANRGRIFHPDDQGACTVVGTVTTSPIEGKVTWRPGKEATGRIMAALGNGTIGDLGLWPLQIAAAPAPTPAVTVIPGSAEPPPLKLHGETYVQPTLDEAQDGKPGAAAA